jgi:hypothetical protein
MSKGIICWLVNGGYREPQLNDYFDLDPSEIKGRISRIKEELDNLQTAQWLIDKRSKFEDDSNEIKQPSASKRNSFDSIFEKYFTGEDWEKQVVRNLRLDLFILACTVFVKTEFQEIFSHGLEDVFAQHINQHFDKQLDVPIWAVNRAKSKCKGNPKLIEGLFSTPQHVAASMLIVPGLQLLEQNSKQRRSKNLPRVVSQLQSITTNQILEAQRNSFDPLLQDDNIAARSLSAQSLSSPQGPIQANPYSHRISTAQSRPQSGYNRETGCVPGQQFSTNNLQVAQSTEAMPSFHPIQYTVHGHRVKRRKHDSPATSLEQNAGPIPSTSTWNEAMGGQASGNTQAPLYSASMLNNVADQESFNYMPNFTEWQLLN